MSDIKTSLKYFDSNVCVGKRGYIDAGALWRSEDIIEVMKNAGISGGLAYAGWARDYTPVYGNERLVGEIEKAKGYFYGCYAVMPGVLGCAPSPNEAVKDIKLKKMAAAVMFPKSQTYLPTETVMGEYYSALEEAGILLIVEETEISPSDLNALLTAHPGLNILLARISWGNCDSIYGLLKKYPNLYVDISLAESADVIGDAAKNVGAERLVFSSGLPFTSPEKVIGMVDNADISDEEKKLIASGNIIRLCQKALDISL